MWARRHAAPAEFACVASSAGAERARFNSEYDRCGIGCPRPTGAPGRFSHSIKNERVFGRNELIEDPNVAKQIADLMQDCTARLDKSVAMVMDECRSEEFQNYRSAVGKVMGEILLEVLNPLYAKHPNLKPPGWD